VTFAGQLVIQHHSNLPAPEKSLEGIQSLLCSAPAEDDWFTE
jgi:hypothetical protein